eukprot:1158318-Pelagomonas_calceolata.AAC.9
MPDARALKLRTDWKRGEGRRGASGGGGATCRGDGARAAWAAAAAGGAEQAQLELLTGLAQHGRVVGAVKGGGRAEAIGRACGGEGDLGQGQHGARGASAHACGSCFFLLRPCICAIGQ